MVGDRERETSGRVVIGIAGKELESGYDGFKGRLVSYLYELVIVSYSIGGDAVRDLLELTKTVARLLLITTDRKLRYSLFNSIN